MDVVGSQRTSREGKLEGRKGRKGILRNGERKVPSGYPPEVAKGLPQDSG